MKQCSTAGHAPAVIRDSTTVTTTATYMQEPHKILHLHSLTTWALTLLILVAPNKRRPRIPSLAQI